MSAKDGRRAFFLDIPVDCVTVEQALSRILEAVRCRRKLSVFTLNVHHLVRTQFDPAFDDAYRRVDLSVADGMPIVWASRILGFSLPERVNGTDLVARCAMLAAREGLRVFLLGGHEGVAREAARRLEKQAPPLRVAGTYAPPFGAAFQEEEVAAIAARVNQAEADLVFVALGPVMQEKWIARYRNRLMAPVTVGVGGALDLLAGRVRRAPRWCQEAGLEWAYRIWQEPERLLSRYIFDALWFPFLILKAIALRAGSPAP